MKSSLQHIHHLACLLLISLGLACTPDPEPEPQLEVPTTYQFERDGA